MMLQSSKSDDSSLCYDVIITNQTLTNLLIFRTISNITVGDVFRDVISLIINQFDPRRL